MTAPDRIDACLAADIADTMAALDADQPLPAHVIDHEEARLREHRKWRWTDDDPQTCARDDDRYWDDLYDRDEEA